MSKILTHFAWRYSLLKRWFFYWRYCINYNEIIQYERTRQPFKSIQLKPQGQIHFEDVNEALLIFQDVFHAQVYTRKYVGKPRVVVDIGANIGTFSLYAAYKWTHSELYAFEPAPHNFSLLQRNVHTMPHTNFHLYNAAATAQAGKINLHLKSSNGWHSVYRAQTDIVLDTVEVEAVDLEAILAECGGKVDFLKLDCEGGEWALFENKMGLVQKSVQYLAMEYHEVEGYTGYQMENWLKKAGFLVTLTKPDQYGTGKLWARKPYAHYSG